MTEVSDTLARRNVFVLVAAQAVLGAQMPMIFTIAGLAGKQLAPNACLATLPISALVIGSMLTATPISAFMARFGRRAGFAIGAAGGAAGAVISAYALSVASFPLFVLGALISGIYMSAQGFYRFAAADTASAAFRPKAISWVMAGGLMSAVFGPELVKLTAEGDGCHLPWHLPCHHCAERRRRLPVPACSTSPSPSPPQPAPRKAAAGWS